MKLRTKEEVILKIRLHPNYQIDVWGLGRNYQKNTKR